MNFGKELRSGALFDALREEESAFKTTFNVDLDEEDDEMIVEEQELTKDDMEEMFRQLRKESTLAKKTLMELEEEIRNVKRNSIFRRKEVLEREVMQEKLKLERYKKQNELIKTLCFQDMDTRYNQDLRQFLDEIKSLVSEDTGKLGELEGKKILSKNYKPETEEKRVQTYISDLSARNRSSSKDTLIETLNKLNQRLRKRLEEMREKSDPLEPERMLVTEEEHKEMLDKAGEIGFIWKQPESLNNQSNGNSSSHTSINGDTKIPEKFYICKCGQKFIKVDKRMRKLDKNYTGISATTAYSIYRNHFSQCPVYLKDAIMCDVCQDVFYSIPCLKVHIRSKHPDCVDLLEKYKHKYVCLCGKSFKNYSQECTALKALRKHAIACPVYRSQAILCQICGVPFLEENHLENHVRMAHKDYYSRKKFPSPIPGSSTSSSTTP